MSIYTLPDLPYKSSSLEPVVSREALELHHEKHHRAYVVGANKALDDMAEARRSGDYSALNQLQKSLAFNLSGHVLHSMLWRVMSPSGGNPAGPFLRDKIAKSFGGYDEMREQLKSCALSIQGSGWAALAWEPLSERLVIEQVHDHQGNIGNATIPVLVLDMWEHAYYLQYRNEKAKWVDRFWEIINWIDVEHRLRGVSQANLMLNAA